MRHKIWESGRHPHRRPDKGKKKPQAIRQARARQKALKKRLQNGDASSFCSYVKYSIKVI